MRGYTVVEIPTNDKERESKTDYDMHIQEN